MNKIIIVDFAETSGYSNGSGYPNSISDIGLEGYGYGGGYADGFGNDWGKCIIGDPKLDECLTPII